MRSRIRIMAVVGLVAAVLVCSTGCLFNIFQTARTIGAGNVALVIGTGLVNLTGSEDAEGYYLTPQARVAIGIADGVDLGLQTGFLVSLAGEDSAWGAATADLKFALLRDSESFAIAVGLGGGYSIETWGWEVLGEVIIEWSPFSPFLYVSPVQTPATPEYVVWRPTPSIFLSYQLEMPFSFSGTALFHHFTAGLAMQLGKDLRVLLQADAAFTPNPFYTAFYYGYGLGFEVGF